MAVSRRTRWFLAAAFVLAVGGAVLLLANAGPVLFTYTEPPSLAPQPAWSLLNPLRSRAPERPAETLLRALRDGRASTVLPPFVQGHAMGPAVMVEREQKCRLVSWRLKLRTDYPDKSELLYHTTRADHPADSKRPVRIRVERSRGGGAWQVTSYSAVY